MKCWIKQKHNQLIDSFRYGVILKENDRVVILCPDTDNELVNCSKSFFEREVAQGRIICNLSDSHVPK